MQHAKSETNLFVNNLQNVLRELDDQLKIIDDKLDVVKKDTVKYSILKQTVADRKTSAKTKLDRENDRIVEMQKEISETEEKVKDRQQKLEIIEKEINDSKIYLAYMTEWSINFDLEDPKTLMKNYNYMLSKVLLAEKHSMQQNETIENLTKNIAQHEDVHVDQITIQNEIKMYQEELKQLKKERTELEKKLDEVYQNN